MNSKPFEFSLQDVVELVKQRNLPDHVIQITDKIMIDTVQKLLEVSKQVSTTDLKIGPGKLLIDANFEIYVEKEEIFEKHILPHLKKFDDACKEKIDLLCNKMRDYTEEYIPNKTVDGQKFLSWSDFIAYGFTVEDENKRLTEVLNQMTKYIKLEHYKTKLTKFVDLIIVTKDNTKFENAIVAFLEN